MSDAHAGPYAMNGGVLVTGAAGFIGKSLIA